MPDSVAAFVADVYFEPTDYVAVFEDSGVVQTRPILLQRSTTANDGADGGSEYFVRLDGNYFLAETVAGFTRYEKVPSARPRPKPTSMPTYTAECRAAKVEQHQSPLERLAAKQREWEASRKGQSQ